MKHKDSPVYEVLCQIDTFYTDVNGFHCLLRTTGPFGGFQDLNELKPYLRPMSSMTEEEKSYVHNGHIEFWVREDYCNKHHLDYRGLIEKGLALEAPEGMYKTE